jgi:hypothetical protein
MADGENFQHFLVKAITSLRLKTNTYSFKFLLMLKMNRRKNDTFILHPNFEWQNPDLIVKPLH